MPRATDPKEDAEAAQLAAQIGIRPAAAKLGRPVPWVQRAVARHAERTQTPAPKDPAARAAEAAAAAEPAEAKPEPADQDAAAAKGPLDANARHELRLRTAAKLATALVREKDPRVVTQLAGMLDRLLTGADKAEQATSPDKARFRIAFYVPQRAA